MEVKLDKQYPLAVDAQRAWAILSDLKATAACMPGADITEQLGESSYKGAVKVKVGPAVAQFGGTVDVLEKDDAARKVVMLGKGADKGGSSASMDLTATVVSDPEDPSRCVLHGVAAVIVNGKFAQFGGRMMVQVSEMILGQFVENFARAAQALPAPADAAAAPAGAAAVAAPAMASAAPAAADPAPAARSSANEINGLAIFWALVKGWFAGLFGKRA
jgi:carbon monoxide dehydrogenase subunit G